MYGKDVCWVCLQDRVASLVTIPAARIINEVQITYLKVLVPFREYGLDNNQVFNRPGVAGAVLQTRCHGGWPHVD